MDMDFENREKVELSEYVRMIELKTAWLLAASLKIGAIVAGADESNSKKLFDFMMKAGTAFQLMDDYLDVYGDPSKFGKQVGGDIRSGKKTFLFLRSLERCGDKDRNRLVELYRIENDRGEEAVKEVAEIFNSCGASSELLAESENLFKSGLEILSQVKGDQQIMDEIVNLTHQLIIREK
jgi:geranylgeranyl diphosphate synthase type II